MDLAGFDTVRQPERQPARPRTWFRLDRWRQRRIRAQHGDLPGDPQPPTMRLSVRHALEVRAHQAPRGGKHFLRGIQSDTADQMHVGSHAASLISWAPTPTAAGPRFASIYVFGRGRRITSDDDVRRD